MMKKITLLFIIISSMIVTGCHDINVLLPEVQNPNQEWKVEYKLSENTPLTTPQGNNSDRFSYSLAKNNTELVIIDTIRVNAASEITPTSSVVNLGRGIEIYYNDKPFGTNNNLPQATMKDISVKHTYNIANIGKGTGKDLNVRINYVYPDSRYGSNRTLFKTISF